VVLRGRANDPAAALSGSQTKAPGFAGGYLLGLEELARAVGLWEEVDRVLAGPKSGRGYQPHEFVQAWVWMQHAGGRRLEDLRELRAEHEVLGALGLKAVPDAGTVGDWRRRLGNPTGPPRVSPRTARSPRRYTA
jgi:hypothetical protein